MSLGQRLLELRKSKKLSQEELAFKLNVTRQTISKWETDQSTPDFDKIVPICELYNISVEELLTGKKEEKSVDNNDFVLRKRAQGIGLSVLLYFISIIWIMITIPVMKMNPIVSSAIFLLICGVGTYYLIYTCMVYKKIKTLKEEKTNKVNKQIEQILSIITLIIYLLISFETMYWHITWIIWIIYALILEIIKLIFMLKGDKNEK